MDSYTSMKNKLQPIGLYNVTDSSNVSAELKAYAEGLDTLFNILDEMTREYFIDTAESYGLSERERFTIRERTEYPTEKRREMLKIQEQMMGNNCSPSTFKKILEGFGLSDFEITENFSEQTVVITINDTLADEAKKYVEERINTEFPVHLIITVNYSE